MYQIIKSHKYWRTLEILPGVLTWTALILPVVLSFYAPEVVAIFVIVYTTFWMFRSFHLSVDLIRAYNKTKRALATDWDAMLDFIEHPEHLDTAIQNTAVRGGTAGAAAGRGGMNEEALRAVAAKINHLKTIGQYKRPSEIYQAILFVTYKESLDLIMQSVRSYANGTFPAKRIILVFSGEEADKINAEQYATHIQKEFAGVFHEIITTIHPRGLPNEIPGKAANATWAGRALKTYLDHHRTTHDNHIPYDNVILSNFDADTVVDPKYFTELTYRYLLEENRGRKTYQPMHFYYNNIWDVPMIVRLISLSSTFVRMGESMNTRRYMNFSSRSMGFQSAIDTDFWDPAVIPEDSRQYWTAYLKYNGDNTLVQVYTPIYMDAVQSETFWQTIKDQYKQLRRWSWGVTDQPFVIINIIRHPSLPLYKKIYCIVRLMQDHFYWATTPLLLTFSGWLPGTLNPVFRETVLSYNLPHIATTLLNFAAIGIVVSAVLTFKTIPRQKRFNLWNYLSLYIMWLFVPLISITLTSIPAIESQTRLILNKRLDYNVTKKHRIITGV